MTKYLVLCLLILAALLLSGCMRSKQPTHFAEGTVHNTTETGSRNHVSGDSQADADITSTVRTIFANDKVLSDSHINVDTNDRAVSLRGSVSSEAVAYRAVRLGRSVDGVKMVHSFLVVR